MVGPNRSRSGIERSGIESRGRLDRKRTLLRAWSNHRKRRRAINEHQRVPSPRWPLPPDSAKRVGRGQRLLEDLRGAQMGAAACCPSGKEEEETMCPRIQLDPGIPLEEKRKEDEGTL